MQRLRNEQAALLAGALAAALALPRRAAERLAPKPTRGRRGQGIQAGRLAPARPGQHAVHGPAGRARGDRTGARRSRPNHAANIKALARENYFDGLAVIRSQDNWVVQWGDPDEKNPRPMKTAKATLKGEFTVPMKNDRHFTRLPDRDGYAPQVGHSNGFPSARDPKTGQRLAGALLRHGRRRARHRRRQRRRLVAVRGDRPRAAPPGPQHHRGRPRRLRHAAAVDAAARPGADGLLRQAGAERADQRRCRVAADVPEAERSKFEVMRTESATYKAVVEAAAQPRRPVDQGRGRPRRPVQRPDPGARSEK